MKSVFFICVAITIFMFGRPAFGEDIQQYYISGSSCTLPAAPMLSSPASNATGQSLTPLLQWSGSGDAISYDCEVCEDGPCENLVTASNGLTETQWNVSPALVPGKEYHWRSKGINTCGDSTWTDTWRFTTKTQGDCSGAIPISAGTSLDGSTEGAGSFFDNYDCTGWPEPGQERIYQVTTISTGTISATLSNLDENVDLDLFLMSGCDISACIAYGDVSLDSPTVPPGTYYIIVDGYGHESVSGSYTLTINAPTCPNYRVKNLTTSVPYNSLAEALSSVGNGQTVAALPDTGNEELVFDRPGISAIVQGGYDCNFQNIVVGGATQLQTLEVRYGTLTVSGLVIR